MIISSNKHDQAGLNYKLRHQSRSLQFVELQLRLENLATSFADFEERCDELASIASSDDHQTARFRIFDSYFAIMSRARETISQTLHAQPNPSTAPSIEVPDIESPTGDRSSSSGTVKRRIKLPQTLIPTFNGSIEQWIGFKKGFASLIHERDDLPDFDKLHYLRSALRDEALIKIELLPITDESYLRAWEILESAYDDKRQLISQHLSPILNLPPQTSNDHRSLQRLADLPCNIYNR